MLSLLLNHVCAASKILLCGSLWHGRRMKIACFAQNWCCVCRFYRSYIKICHTYFAATIYFTDLVFGFVAVQRPSNIRHAVKHWLWILSCFSTLSCLDTSRDQVSPGSMWTFFCLTLKILSLHRNQIATWHSKVHRLIKSPEKTGVFRGIRPHVLRPWRPGNDVQARS